ncbi:MAG TPA: site-specific integrase, partial [Armatimonadota bacterium]|nr:site-specific integrase [Armatimonadota bacterium]
RIPPTEECASYLGNQWTHLARRKGGTDSLNPNGAVRTPRISFAPEQFRSIEAEWLVYLRDIRGATPSTVENYSRAAARFFSFLLEKGIGDMARVGPEEMRAFHDATLALTPNQRSMVYNSLRCLFRFAALKGWTNADLIELVGRSPRYKLARLPDFLSDEEVRKVLDTPDVATSAGVRDLAMLSLLATYGLRGGDLAALTLDDFDWERDLIRVRQNKVGRSVWLPLLPGAGNAVLKYIQEARPATQGREVFLRRYAPHIAIGEGAVYAVVIRICQKAGVKKRRLGPHLFRHTMATRLVRNSEPLKTVGDILGHNCAASTAIYAKVAVEQLREVALSFEEARP